jgi:hypothetical protein
MDTLALVVWSMALGTIFLFASARLAGLPPIPPVAGPRHRLPPQRFPAGAGAQRRAAAGARLPRPLHALQVLAGPLCVGLSNFWIHGWLRAAQRDRLMAWRCAPRLALPLLARWPVALPQRSSCRRRRRSTLLGSGLTLWLTVRGWLMGDRMALTMAAGCLLTLPAIAGCMPGDAPGAAGAGDACGPGVLRGLSNCLTGLVPAAARSPRGPGAARRLRARQPSTP